MRVPSPDSDAPPDKESVGAFLRRRRQSRHETLNHVSEALRIRLPYLQAIEEDDWGALPDAVYARAFLRSYAAHVEADPEEVLAMAEARLERRPGPDTPLPPLPARDRSLPGGALVGLSVLLVLVVYAGWYYYSVEQLRDERVVAAAPDRLLSEFAPVLRSPEGGEAEPPLADGRWQAAIPEEAAMPEAESRAPVENLADGIRPGLPAVAAPAPMDARATPRGGAGDLAPDGIVFHALLPTYIEVRSLETDRTVASRLLKAGEYYRAPDRRGLVLSVGNAGGLRVTVDGQPAPALGAPGTVLRHVPIDATLLLQGRAGG